MSRARAVIYGDVEDERARQDAQWGGADHDDAHQHTEWGDFIAHQLEYIFRDDDVDTDEVADRRRFVKIAALAVAAVEAIDRRAARDRTPMPLAKIATLVLRLGPQRGADQRVYRLSAPHGGFDHVLVSAVDVGLTVFSPLLRGHAEPILPAHLETYIFGCDPSGKVIGPMLELEGSFRGAMDHARALRGAGYEIAGGDS